jgi:hypothetical protein
VCPRGQLHQKFWHAGQAKSFLLVEYGVANYLPFGEGPQQE